jgi:hypothetical protein
VHQTHHTGPPPPTPLAFVVQFAAETAVEPGRFVGRVEHVVSGQAQRFHTREELLAWLTQMLTALRPPPAAAPDTPREQRRAWRPSTKGGTQEPCSIVAVNVEPETLSSAEGDFP